MKKGLSISVFVVGLLLTGLSLTTVVLGACGMGTPDSKKIRF